MAKNKLRCTVTGEWYGVSKARREKLIASFGSVEELEKGYVSRDGKRLLAEGHTPEAILDMDLSTKTIPPKRKATAQTKADEVIGVPRVAEDPNADQDVKDFMAAGASPAPAAMTLRTSWQQVQEMPLIRLSNN